MIDSAEQETSFQCSAQFSGRAVKI